jgi:hypothetical protein
MEPPIHLPVEEILPLGTVALWPDFAAHFDDLVHQGGLTDNGIPFL